MYALHSFSGTVAALRRHLHIDAPVEKQNQPLDVASKILLWIAALALLGTFTMSTVHAFAGSVDPSTETCTLLDKDSNGNQWYKCLDVDQNVAYRPALTR